MESSKGPIRRMTWMVVAGMSAFVLTAVVLQLFSSAPVAAQQVADVMAPKLSVEKTVDKTSAAPGDTLTYVIRIANPGEAVSAWMTDELPAELTYVGSSVELWGHGNADYANGAVTWTYDDFGYGANAVISFSAQINSELEQADIVNMAQITGTGELITDSAETAVRSSGALSDHVLFMPYFPKRWPPLPYAPVLQDIADPGIGVNDYTVRWSYEHPSVNVITYTLEEANNPNFVGATEYVVPHAGAENELAFTDKPDGTYYYRVSGNNQWGQGMPSNIKGVTIFTAYYDNFSSSASGWPNERGDIIDDRGVDQGDWYRRYKGGDYQIYIPQAECWTCYWFYQPDAFAPYRPPTNKYCVETRARFQESGWWANMGLIFGADEKNETLYSLCLSQGSDQQRLGWFLMRKDDYDFPHRGCSGPTFKIDGSDKDGTSRTDWNDLKVGVDGDTVRVWIGGLYKGKYSMEGLTSMTRVGLIAGVYEILAVDARFDYFRVTPNSDCTE
jgi:uncharacterized repeat protein (TIGR01451 family)